MGQDQVCGGVNGLCQLAAPVAIFPRNLPKIRNKVKVDNKAELVIRSQIGVMSDQLRVLLYMFMSQNVM